MSGQIINLAVRTPVFEGKERRIYAHPDDTELLIKIARAEPLGHHQSKIPQGHRYGPLANAIGELSDQLAIRSSGVEHPPYLQNIVGFADTDLGLGVVVKALFGKDGAYAPTLYRIVADNKFNSTARTDLEHFLKWVIEADVVLNDINARNLVYAHRNGASHFVLVDGYGGVPTPLYRLFPGLQKTSKRRKAKRLFERLKTIPGRERNG